MPDLGDILAGPVKGLVSAIGGIIDDLTTSSEEKLQAKLALSQLENELTIRLVEAEQTLVQEKAKVLVAEAQGESWLQRNWRPITMMTFVFIVAWNFIFAPMLSSDLALEIPDKMWTLLQLGIGGYIVGRSVEKTVKTVANGKNGKNGTPGLPTGSTSIL